VPLCSVLPYVVLQLGCVCRVVFTGGGSSDLVKCVPIISSLSQVKRHLMLTDLLIEESGIPISHTFSILGYLENQGSRFPPIIENRRFSYYKIMIFHFKFNNL
jgi:hypothetical protein